MSILILNDKTALKIQFSHLLVGEIFLYILSFFQSLLNVFTLDYPVLMLLMLYELCVMYHLIYFLFTSCLTHFTSLSYSSETIKENNQKRNHHLGHEN